MLAMLEEKDVLNIKSIKATTGEQNAGHLPAARQVERRMVPGLAEQPLLQHEDQAHEPLPLLPDELERRYLLGRDGERGATSLIGAAVDGLNTVKDFGADAAEFIGQGAADLGHRLST